jgi:hypothetical protein
VRPLFVVVLLAIGCGRTTVDTLYTCKACLATDGNRCASYAQRCGDGSNDRMGAEAGATDALCDTLTAAELASRPTPQGYHQNASFTKNECYVWPKEAFALTCTTTRTKCSHLPIR